MRSHVMEGGMSTDAGPPPALERPGDHARGGGPRAAELVIYGDYECPYTRAAYRNVQRLERRLSEELRFVFRHFPLRTIHPHAQAAAEAAEAAHAQDRFWAMHDLMFKRQQALEAKDLRAYAAEVGLRVELFEAELANHSHAERVERDVRTGLSANVGGTPTLFLAGRLHDGSYDARVLGPLIEQLAEATDDLKKR
jgi:protein-disulfide isomerase